MATCTAPINGHRTASGKANCPVCGSNSRSYYSQPYLAYSSSSNESSYNGNSIKTKARWSSKNSTILYTPSEIRTLTPIRENIEKRANKSDLRDIFLCHAWDDRKGIAKQLHYMLELKGVSVWFSEKDVSLGSNLLREIDKGLVKSRIGLVLVTPAFLKRIKGEGIADKELSALLARDLLVPIIHDTTYEDLREVSPLLGSRSGLNTREDSINTIAEKLAELVNLQNL
jgi:TIR domain.